VKVPLLFADRDFDPSLPAPWNSEALIADLGLQALFDAMSDGDSFRGEVVKAVLLHGAGTDAETIRWRQQVLRDCLANRDVVRGLYALATRAAEEERKHYLGSVLASHPGTLLHRSASLLEALLSMLKELAGQGRAHADRFRADGWRMLFAAVERELDDAYFTTLEELLAEVRFRRGLCFSARLGMGNKSRDFVLRRPPGSRRWLGRLLHPEGKVLQFALHPRDEAGARALGELRDRAISGAAAALNRSATHVQTFFNSLRTELAFYTGALALHEKLERKGEPLVFPELAGAEEGRLSFRGLYDVALSLGQSGRLVGNEACADGKDLLVITGANGGGKSTFLRALGLAQMMLQCGLFVPAETFTASLRDQVCSHFRREEDSARQSGKFEEELRRMSAIVDHATPHTLLLCNESFAATSEREGSLVAQRVCEALCAHGMRVVFVTHLATLAQHWWRNRQQGTLFLRADRTADGGRTFRLFEGEPLATSFGADLYREVFPATSPTAKVAAWT
jgi:hypothetical protein